MIPQRIRYGSHELVVAQIESLQRTREQVTAELKVIDRLQRPDVLWNGSRRWLPLKSRCSSLSKLATASGFRPADSLLASERCRRIVSYPS